MRRVGVVLSREDVSYLDLTAATLGLRSRSAAVRLICRAARREGFSLVQDPGTTGNVEAARVELRKAQK